MLRYKMYIFVDSQGRLKSHFLLLLANKFTALRLPKRSVRAWLAQLPKHSLLGHQVQIPVCTRPWILCMCSWSGIAGRGYQVGCSRSDARQGFCCQLRECRVNHEIWRLFNLNLPLLAQTDGGLEIFIGKRQHSAFTRGKIDEQPTRRIQMSTLLDAESETSGSALCRSWSWPRRLGTTLREKAWLQHHPRRDRHGVSRKAPVLDCR